MMENQVVNNMDIGMSDEGGLEGLPFKLIIISLILALSMPIIISNWMSYDRQQTINRLTTEFNYIEAQIDQMYDEGMGIGNSKLLEVNIKDGTFTKIEYVEIGDSDLDSFRGRSIHWKINGEDEQLYLISNGIPVKSEDSSSFELRQGLNELYLEIKKEGELVYVEISEF